MFSTVRRVALNPVSLSRLLGVFCQVSIVIAAPLILKPDQTNEIYSVIAWSAIISVIGSFGANGALVTRSLRMTPRELEETVGLLLFTKLVTCFLAGAILILFGVKLGFFLLSWTSFTLALNFIDFVAEARGSVAVQKLAIHKIPILVLASIAKLVTIAIVPRLTPWLIYIEWPFIWLISVSLARRNADQPWFAAAWSIHAWKQFYSLFAKSFWVWISGIVQLGWTRGLFLFLSSMTAPGIANSFFLFTRIVEGFAFVPNAISTQFFPDLVRAGNSSERIKVRIQFMTAMQTSAVGIAIAGPAIIFAMTFFSKSIHISPVALAMMAIAGFFFVLRVAVSREIVLQDVLFLSLSSYLIGILANVIVMLAAGLTSLNVIMLGYTAFMILNFGFPIIAEWNKFSEFRQSLGVRHA